MPIGLERPRGFLVLINRTDQPYIRIWFVQTLDKKTTIERVTILVSSSILAWTMTLSCSYITLTTMESHG